MNIDDQPDGEWSEQKQNEFNQTLHQLLADPHLYELYPHKESPSGFKLKETGPSKGPNLLSTMCQVETLPTCGTELRLSEVPLRRHGDAPQERRQEPAPPALLAGHRVPVYPDTARPGLPSGEVINNSSLMRSASAASCVMPWRRTCCIETPHPRRHTHRHACS